jgi:hypothetical protein
LLFSHAGYALKGMYYVISSYISVGVIFLYFSHRQFIPRTSVFLLELCKYIINRQFHFVTLLLVFPHLNFSYSSCCHPNRISYIVMIGQVLQLLGCTSNSMFITGCQMAGLYLLSTILNLAQIKLAKQWHTVIRLQL